jgi:hypothetical protein
VLNCGLAAELAASRAAAGAPVDDVLAVVARTKPWSKTRTLVFEVARLTAAIGVAARGRPVDDDRLARLDDLIGQCAAYVEWLRDDAPARPWATACMQWTRAERAHLGGAPDPTLWDPVVAALDERGHVPYGAVTRLRRADARAEVDGGSSPACVQDLLAAWDVFTDLGLTALQDDAAALARRLRVALPDVTDGSDRGQNAYTALPDLTDREREVRGGEQSTGCSGGSPLAGIVQHLPGGLRGVAQPLAILGGRGPRRGIGDESVEARQILEVTLGTPNVVAGRGTRLDHQRAQQVGTRKRRDTAVEVDGDSLGAVQGLAGSRELGCAQRRDRGQIGAPPMPSGAITSNSRPSRTNL